MTIDSPSPNHGARPDGARIDLVVLHYTGMATAEAALDRLRDPAARVSAHYLIEEAGAVHRLVAEERRAWHAGKSSWRGAANVNDRSIGIELANPGHGPAYRPFPDAQMAALERLLADVLARRGIDRRRVIGHSDAAPARKADPGELFDWPRLARRGLAWMPEAAPAPAPPDEAAARESLRCCGYGVEPESASFAACLTAFQRRFRPARCDGALDAETMGLVRAAAEGLR